MTFQEIYNDYNKLVYNLALQYVQNIEDAQEITQDTFISIHLNLHTFQGNARISTWIYRITINKSLDFIKAQKSKKRFAVLTSLFHLSGAEIKHHSSIFDHPGVLLEQKEAMEKIFAQINNLPAKQKTALILKKLEQKSQKEVSDIMGISEKAVESLLQRAKVNLTIKLNLTKEI